VNIASMPIVGVRSMTKKKKKRHPSIDLALLLGCMGLGCAPDAAPAPLPYPEPDAVASCTTSPSLCGLPLHDLGGGTHKNAWHIVFLGDGYLEDELPDFVWQANSLASLMLRPDGVFSTNDLVAHSPELFHFWRIDVPSASIEVDDDVLTNTPLGAHLGPPDMCPGQPYILALEERFALALENARLVSAEEDENDRLWWWGHDDAGFGDLRPDEITRWPHVDTPLTVSRATFALLSHRSSGRANADWGGKNVRISSTHSVDTLAHELGHALFSLGDEYTEFFSCGEALAPWSGALPAESSEVALLETANTSTLLALEKWEHDVESVMPGGNRWPCHAHPTNSCLMLGGGALCPVCSSAVAERVAMRRCEPDTRPPRVAIEPSFTVFSGGTKALVAASAFDERRASRGGGPLSLSWVVDGNDANDPRTATPVATGPFAVVDLTIEQGRLLRAVASDDTFSARSAAITLPALPGADDDGEEPPTLAPLMAAGTDALVEDPVTGVVHQRISGIGRRVTVALRPQTCTRVARASVVIHTEDGTSSTAVASGLEAEPRINCGSGTPSAITLSFDRPADTGIFKIRGSLVDTRGRSASTHVWTPRAVDDDECTLGLRASDDTDRSTHGPFDGLTIATNAPYPVGYNVRAGHGAAVWLPREGLESIHVLPISFPSPVGQSVDVAVLAVCPRLTPSGPQLEYMTSSIEVPFAWDIEAPAIAASSSLPPDTETWELAVLDDSPITKVTISRRIDDTAGDVFAELTAPPWRVSPPPHGAVRIRATDVAGNVAERDVDVVRQHTLDSFVECP
jgi:hypothetical protein